MKIIRLIILAGTLLVLTSCAEVSKEETLRVDGLICLKDNHQPFSGTVLENYPDGTLKSKVHYAGGLPDGKAIYYHPNGRKEDQGQYRDGKKDGKWPHWSDSSEMQFVEYYEYGVLQSKDTYQDGILDVN